MGLLGDLLKKEAKKMLSEAVADRSRNNHQTSASQSRNETSRSDQNSGQNAENWESVTDRIRRVIAENYAGYEVRERVPATEWGGTRDMRTYDFVLYSAGEAKLTILVLSGGADYKRKAVKDAHTLSEQKGAHCINIMEYLPSTYEYINERIRSFL